jgi:tetratricopeptide (TPR) repeat protein
MKRLALALSFAVTLTAAPAPTALDRARALYESGCYAEASAAFEPLARGVPANATLLFYLGKLAVHRRDYATALDLLGRADACAPRDPAITLWLGNAHAWSASIATGFKDRVSHGRRALALYRRAVELDPESVPARFALMNFYRHVPALLGGGLERADEQAREIARRDAITGAYARALLSFHEKKFIVAYDTLRQLLAKRPQHYGANFLLGRLAAACGEHREEARAALRRCLALTPSETDDPHDDARALLAQLEAGAAASASPVAR